MARGRPAAARVRLALPSWPHLAVWGLGGVLLIEAVWLIVQAVRPLPEIPVPVVASPSADEPATAAAVLDGLPALSATASQPLFTPPAATPSMPSASAAIPSASVRQLAARLTLTGIIAGSPAQAIIEDAETKKTYFVTAGQAVVDGAVLEQVLDNRVILDRAGEKIELSL